MFHEEDCSFWPHTINWTGGSFFRSFFRWSFFNCRTFTTCRHVFGWEVYEQCRAKDWEECRHYVRDCRLCSTSCHLTEVGNGITYSRLTYWTKVRFSFSRYNSIGSELTQNRVMCDVNCQRRYGYDVTNSCRFTTLPCSYCANFGYFRSFN